MSKELKKAQEDLKAFAKLFNAVQVMADELQDIKSLEAMGLAADSKYKKALKDLEEAKAALEAATKEVAEAKASKKDLEDKAKKSVKDAEKKAEGILADADSQLALAVAKVAELRKEADLLAAGMSEDLVKLKKDVSDKQNELNALQSKIDAAKESIRVLVA